MSASVHSIVPASEEFLNIIQESVNELRVKGELSQAIMAYIDPETGEITVRFHSTNDLMLIGLLEACKEAVWGE